MTASTAQEQADKLEAYLLRNCGGTLDLLFAESLGCGPAVFLHASKNLRIRRMILSGPEYLDFGIWNPLILKIMPQKQFKTAKTRKMPSWALRFMGQTEAGIQTMLSRIPDHVSLESVRATWQVGLYLYRMLPERQPDAEVVCWYGQREGYMKKTIEKLWMVYPKLTVRCFPDFGHGDILNHPQLLVQALQGEMV